MNDVFTYLVGVLLLRYLAAGTVFSGLLLTYYYWIGGETLYSFLRERYQHLPDDEAHARARRNEPRMLASMIALWPVWVVALIVLYRQQR